MLRAMVEAKLLQEAPLLVLPTLASAVGLNEAIVLQQLHFRTRVAEDGWWYASVAELRREFPFWSEATIKRVMVSVEREGLVKVRQVGTDRTKRYRIDRDALATRVPQTAPLDGRGLATDRADASAQGAPVSFIGRKKNSSTFALLRGDAAAWGASR
jgi:hypothetical protein